MNGIRVSILALIAFGCSAAKLPVVRGHIESDSPFL